MKYLAITFFASLLVTLLVIRSAKQHASLSADHDLSGPQKFHSRPVPRIGGIGIMAATLVGIALAQWSGLQQAGLLWLLVACALPTFLAGLLEDLTKNLSPRRRLFFTATSAGLAVWLMDAVILRTDIIGIDALIALYPCAVLLTVFAVAGVANAVNIIDGFNGLASMCVLLMMLAMAYVAYQVGDQFIFVACLMIVGSVLGFFAWNYPAGLIFLGDGGAYFLGFILAELSILLLHRNPGVSPMFPLLLCAYPIFETVFSIYRKKFLRGMSPGVPDGIHLHMLVYKRLMRWAVGRREARVITRRNSLTSPYLWVLCLMSVVPAILWWESTPILAFFLVLFMFSYTMLYWSIVRFRVPRWLVIRR
jgi:UDP-N-acetylmuramyl pentapeptide phosphotransferase/UDP-N-acetylglucosamine-1-phosphate transferase